LRGVKLVAYPRQNQYGFIVSETSVQDRLEHVVDDPAVPVRDRPDIDALDRISRTGVHVDVSFKMVGKRPGQP